jgi:hypothetical protein
MNRDSKVLSWTEQNHHRYRFLWRKTTGNNVALGSGPQIFLKVLVNFFHFD